MIFFNINTAFHCYDIYRPDNHIITNKKAKIRGHGVQNLHFPFTKDPPPFIGVTSLMYFHAVLVNN